MILHFEDKIAAFSLQADKKIDRILSDLDFGCSNCYTDQDGNASGYYFVFINEDIPQEKEIEIELESGAGFKEIHGLYTVPELQLENKSFLEVIKAVQLFYNKKAALPLPL